VRCSESGELTEPKYESARQYFKDNQIQDYLSEISPQITQKEIRLSRNLLCQDSKGTSLVSKLKNDRNESRLLLDYKPDDEDLERTSVLMKISEEECDELAQHFQMLRSYLKPKERAEFLGHLAKYTSPSIELEFKTLGVAKHIIDFYKDVPDVEEAISIENLEIPTIFNDSQVAEINNIVSLMLRKIPAEMHDQVISKINNELYWNFNGLDTPQEHLLPNFNNILREFIKSDRYDFEDEFYLPKFSISESISVTFENESQVKEALESLPELVNYPENIILPDFTESRIVNLADVVGGYNMQGWEISTSSGRGLPNILENSKRLAQSGYIDTKNPISYVYYKGKYFAYGDGRHRSVALKIMGVEKIPAKVYVVEDKPNF